MSIHVPVPTEFAPAADALAPIAPSPADAFASWRGHALQWFAGAELSINEALARARRDGLISLVPHSMDERFDCLGALLAPGAAWQEEDGKIRDTLFEYARFFGLRESLIHGLARIEPLAGGGFVVRLYRMDRMGRELRETLFEDELAARAEELRNESRMLRDMIRHLVESAPPPRPDAFE